jgi:hypothetical protein
LDEVKGLILCSVQAKGVRMTTVKPAKIIGVLFIVINLFVSICIVENRNLAPIENKYSVLIDMDTNRLVESSGIPLSGNIFQII